MYSYRHGEERYLLNVPSDGKDWSTRKESRPRLSQQSALSTSFPTIGLVVLVAETSHLFVHLVGLQKCHATFTLTHLKYLYPLPSPHGFLKEFKDELFTSSHQRGHQS